MEKFWHNPNENHLNFIKTIDIPPISEGGAPFPNDVFAPPELDDKNAFFVTNDNVNKKGWKRDFESLTRLPITHLSYYDDEKGWKIVVKGIQSANGITGTKKMVAANSADPPPENQLYISAASGGMVRVFSRTYGSSELHPIQDVYFDGVTDNPSLSYPSQSQLVVAVHVDPLAIYSNPANPTHNKASPAGIFSFSTNQIGSGFYGHGYTGEVTVETVYLDRRGVLVNATTTSVLVESKQPGERGDLYVTGLMNAGIVKCKEFVLS